MLSPLRFFGRPSGKKSLCESHPPIHECCVFSYNLELFSRRENLFLDTPTKQYSSHLFGFCNKRERHVLRVAASFENAPGGIRMLYRRGIKSRHGSLLQIRGGRDLNSKYWSTRGEKNILVCVLSSVAVAAGMLHCETAVTKGCVLFRVHGTCLEQNFFNDGHRTTNHQQTPTTERMKPSSVLCDPPSRGEVKT